MIRLGFFTRIPTQQEFDFMKQYAAILLDAEMMPNDITWKILPTKKNGYKGTKRPDKQQVAMAIVKMKRGMELDLPLQFSIDRIMVIGNKTGLDGFTMLAIIHKNVPKAEIDFIQWDLNACKIKTTRPGKKSQTFEYTQLQAIADELWKDWKFKKDHLAWMTIKRMGRFYYPEITAGLSLIEDLQKAAGLSPSEIQAPLKLENKKEVTLGQLPNLKLPKLAPPSEDIKPEIIESKSEMPEEELFDTEKLTKEDMESTLNEDFVEKVIEPIEKTEEKEEVDFLSYLDDEKEVPKPEPKTEKKPEETSQPEEDNSPSNNFYESYTDKRKRTYDIPSKTYKLLLKENNSDSEYGEILNIYQKMYDDKKYKQCLGHMIDDAAATYFEREELTDRYYSINNLYIKQMEKATKELISEIKEYFKGENDFDPQSILLQISMAVGYNDKESKWALRYLAKRNFLYLKNQIYHWNRDK